MQTVLRSTAVPGVSAASSRPAQGRRSLVCPLQAAAAPAAPAVHEHTEAPPQPLMDVEARRLAMAAERRQRAAERQRAETEDKWWEVDCPSNMLNVGSVQEMQAAIANASSAGVLAVVNFFAEECYACRSLQPKLRQMARDAPEVVFIKVNGSVDELRAYCEQAGITRIPYFHLYCGGERVSHFTANMRPEKLKLLRSEIAKHRSGSGEAATAAPMAAFC